MEKWLILITTHVALLIEVMALVVILIGTIEAFFSGIRVTLSKSCGNHEKREVWLQYARWLIAALTFQLASDIIETAIAPTWDDIGRLGAIAAIRTFLNIFLERDLTEVRDRQHEGIRSNGGAS